MKNYLLRIAQSKTCLLTLLFSMCILSVFGQNKDVSGQIFSDDGDPLPGVTILIKDSKKGTVTDVNGYFTISASPDDILVCTFIGFEKTETPIANRSNLTIIMKLDITQMEEVVVVGYGTQKKSHLTGAISKVENETLEQMPVSRVDDALVGQVSGVNIQSTEGEAGSSPTIRIRGTGSITGSSAPAIVVDGLVVDNDFLANLDMNTVESFEVLKDAASSAIYGSRGANGVILITTKQGKAGKTKFSYNGYYGMKEAYHSDAYSFSVAETAAAELAANGELSSRTLYKQLIGIDRDWQDVIFDGGTIQNHSISARGGNDKSKFSASLSYLHDEGVLLTDDFKRYNLRLKIDTEINDKLSFGASITPSYSDRRRFDGSTHDILRQTPWLPVYHDENTIQYVDRDNYPDVQIGDYAEQRHFDNYDLYGDGSELVDISNTSNTNPAAKVQERDRNEYKFKTFGSIYLEYEIIEDLKFKTIFSGDYQITKQDRWQGVLSSRNGAAAAQYDVSNLDRTHLVTENYFTYSKSLGHHDFNAVAGFSAERYDTRYESITGTGYDSDLIKTISAATQIASAESNSFENRFMSFYGRVNYSYFEKYLASISIRRDGSSIFGPENKFGNFPAFSIGWRLSEEGFLSNSKIIDELKLRASYGFTGNNRLNTGNDLVDNYPYLPLMEANTAVVNNSIVGAYNALNIANPGLQWERSREFNPAIDFVLFDGVFSGSLDYYVRTSDQLLLFNPISSTTGFNNALVNLGEVKNSGIEMEFRTRNINTENFKWSTTLLLSKNKNELVDFAESNGQIQNVDSKRASEWINLEGHPISSFYGWVVDRDIPLEYLNNAYHPVGGEAQDVYVKDLNGDGLIDDDDKTIIGNPYPDLIWSLTNTFTYKNFDVSFLFQGSHGAEVRNMGDQYLFNHFNSSQDFDPAITPDQEFIKEKIFTNDIVQDASYVALRNLNIGYNFTNSTLTKMGLNSLRVYAAGQNLLYFTADDYTGFNPESIDNTSSTTYGYQRAGSPTFRTVSLGINLEF
ncbi:SusC/RagA family TonB-linked outer membrane protein [Marinigracilibium pacificum]|uniref:TonB-dependent receptor n=1 Tax=Marinigracilibium pacificum TaxID=2729599 RepID=A0A848IX50_9BACT|nr:TonB-dependent receptor [Marinigracilibium pacificum]NMM48887.1 TonB-dependent receptor [Marinigracilibium pacificum]